MTPQQQNKIVNDIITQVIKDEQLAREAEIEKQSQLYSNYGNTLPNTNTSTAWYFYNPATVNFGKTDFIKIWGSRKA